MEILGYIIPISILRTAILVLLGIVFYYSFGRFGRKVVAVALAKRKIGLTVPDHDLTKDQLQRIETISDLTDKIARIVIVLVFGTIVLSEFGVNIGPIIAGAGVIGIALGFGAQSLVKDFLSGIFIVFENQYAKGDTVELCEVRGKVVDFSLRRTVLRDMDGIEHHIPNGEIKRAANLTKDWANINLSISVDYDSDIEQVNNVLTKVSKGVSSDPEWKVYILTEPSVLGITAFEDSAIVVKLHGKVDADQKYAIERELRKRIKIAFDEAGIVIPYPHQVTVQKKSINN